MGRGKVISGIVGNRIKELRTIRGVSQKELADLLSKSERAVRMWELGKSEPDLLTVVKLANYFGVSLDELLKLDDFTAEDEKTIGGRIKKARISKGRKQSELADMLELNLSLVTLAKCLDLSRNYLLGYEEDNENGEKDDA